MGNSLKVITEDLSAFGKYLTDSKEELDGLLDQLSGKMSTIKSVWQDDNGSQFSSKFEQFVKDSKKITTAVNLLGQKATEISANYEVIVTDHAKDVWV